MWSMSLAPSLQWQQGQLSYGRLFLIIFIKTNDIAKHNLAEVILSVAKVVLTKYAPL